MRASLLILATVAAFATGQINAQAPPARDYSEAYPLAVKDGSFLVTWVGVVPSVRIDGTLTATVDSLKGYEVGDVVISGPSRDGKHVWYATFKTPSDAELKTAIKASRGSLEAERKVSLMARPFSEFHPPQFAPHDDDLSATGPWPRALKYIEGMMRYKRAQHTQRLAETSFNGGPFVDTIEPVHRSKIDVKWHQSGGMLGIEGVRSDLYRNDVAAKAKPFVDNIPVLNSFGYYQNVRGWKRVYPDGSKFLDVLSRSGEVFEVRQREKVEGKWKSTVLFEEPKVRPLNYKRFAVDCASCHDLAGTGGYAAGLTPGADGVLSDPFDALERAK